MAFGDYLAKKGVSCRPLFDFVCEIDTVEGILFLVLVFTFLNYLLFRFLAKSQTGRFFIGLTFVVFCPFIGFIIYRNYFLIM